MPQKQEKVTYVFFSEANHNEWEGHGTVEVSDEFGHVHCANYFGGLAAQDFRLIPASGDTSPPNPHSYVCLGKMESGILKPLEQHAGPV